jgi:hypothetical protein
MDDALCTGTKIPNLKERTLLVSCIVSIGTTGIAIQCFFHDTRAEPGTDGEATADGAH